MEKKRLRVNAGKTKIMISGTGLDLLQSSGEFPCAVCRTGVGSNSIFCNGCKHWVHKKCNGLKRLKKKPWLQMYTMPGNCTPLRWQTTEVQVGPDKLEVVASFCYLGDMLSAAGGCELSTTTMCENRLKKFKDLLPVLSSDHLSFKTCGRVYSSCVRSAMLHAGETWPLTKPISSVCSEWQGKWSDRSAMSGSKTLSPTGPLSYLCGLALRIWTSFWRREDSDGTNMWNAPMVQSRQPLTYRLIESVGLGGPKGHGNSCLFVLRFYGPVNPMGSCRARSVYLTTRLLGRLSPLSS